MQQQQSTKPQERKPFFTATAEEGNKCVVCKSTHVGVSTGMATFAGHHTIKTWRSAPLGNKFLNIGVVAFFLALGGWHGYDLKGLWSELKEKEETIPRFAKRQIKIFLARHGI